MFQKNLFRKLIDHDQLEFKVLSSGLILVKVAVFDGIGDFQAKIFRGISNETWEKQRFQRFLRDGGSKVFEKLNFYVKKISEIWLGRVESTFEMRFLVKTAYRRYQIFLQISFLWIKNQSKLIRRFRSPSFLL